MGAGVEKAVERTDPRSVSSISVPVEFNKQGTTKKLSQKHYIYKLIFNMFLAFQRLLVFYEQRPKFYDQDLIIRAQIRSSYLTDNSQRMGSSFPGSARSLNRSLPFSTITLN